MRLKAVTFDLWQTLLLDTPDGLRRARAGRIQGAWAALRRQGIPLELAQAEGAYDAVGVRLEQLWATRRDVGSRGQVRFFLEHLGLAETVRPEDPLMDALEEAYSSPILSALPTVNDGATEALARLQDRGQRLGLICNTGRTSGRMLRVVLSRLGLTSFLSVLTFSDEVGLRKPHPEVFRRTLSALGVSPREAVHVGDDPRTDVAGARGVGMRAIHLSREGGLSQNAGSAESIASLRALPELLFAGEFAEPLRPASSVSAP